MINNLIRFSIANRFFIVLASLFLTAAGVFSALQLPIDAVPDVTNKQVQINTVAPGLAPQEIERQITFPLEVALAGMPRLKETRSISQFGLSQVTVIFDDNIDIYFARQLVQERLTSAGSTLPEGIEAPEMGPVSTGLGEIYYVVVEGSGSLMERRTILDGIVRPQLRTVPGLSEVNSFGGEEKQFQVLVDPQKLASRNIPLRQVMEALQENNQNAGGGYLRRGDEQQLVRGVGVIQNESDISGIVVGAENGIPITIRDVASVTTGGAIRQGAVTMNGKGEAVTGITMLLLGENGRTVVERVKERVVTIQKSLPAGTKLTGFMDRSDLINRTLKTAIRNLSEGGLLVILVLFLFLLQLRAGLIVSSVIPLAMLIAIIGMKQFNVSANLMSLGAIDFGLIVDGAVIIVENCIRRLSEKRHEMGRVLSEPERLDTITQSTIEMVKPSIFGIGIIVAAYLPILTLQGIEGKMFQPMGLTVIMALLGAMVLSVTLIPALCAYFLEKRPSPPTPLPTAGEGSVGQNTISNPDDNFRASPPSPAVGRGVGGEGHQAPHHEENPVLRKLTQHYAPALRYTMQHRVITASAALIFFLACASLFPRLGSEFIPRLDEGALAIQVAYPPSMSLEKAVERSTYLEKQLKEKFPNEIDQILTRLGRAEVATDPMLVSQHDIIISLQPQENWKKVHSKTELVEQVTEVVSKIPGMGASYTQPIQMRMNELIEGIGIRSELGIKLYGDDLETLATKGSEIGKVLRAVPGSADVAVETTEGLPVLNIVIDRARIARYGINVSDVQRTIEMAVGGAEAGQIIQGNLRFDLVVRLKENFRDDPEAVGRILVPAPGGEAIPLSQLATIESTEGPVQVSRENGERRVVIQSNVRGRDLGSFVENVKREVDAKVKLPPGYHIEYGGTYEHLQSGQKRLMIVVPITFAVIFLLLFTTFNSLKQAALVFTGIPFAITGGILALFFRGMPFSISAGVGFIALFGVAVLNGVVMVTFINEIRAQGKSVFDATLQGALTRLRPVLMTATVAGIGFIPMALGHGAGSEVQKPLATVVIGGLITSTLLTLFVLPTLYNWFERDEETQTI